MHDWRSRLPELYRLSLEVFRDNVAFAPISFASFSSLYGATAFQAACKKTSAMAFDTDGRIIGFCLNFPDPSDPSRLLIKSAGVHPDARTQGFSFFSLVGHILKTGDAYEKATPWRDRFTPVTSSRSSGSVDVGEEINVSTTFGFRSLRRRSLLERTGMVLVCVAMSTSSTVVAHRFALSQIISG